jgi:hypothetical protein
MNKETLAKLMILICNLCIYEWRSKAESIFKPIDENDDEKRWNKIQNVKFISNSDDRLE